MDATNQNFSIVERIMELLAKEKCTVQQATEILGYVNQHIRETSTVQIGGLELVQSLDTVD